MRHGTGFFVLAISLAANYAAAAERFSYPPTISLEEVRQWIDKAPVAHPRLLPGVQETRPQRDILTGIAAKGT